MASERDIAIWLFFRYRHPSRWYFSPVFVMYTVSPPPPLAAAAAAAAAAASCSAAAAAAASCSLPLPQQLRQPPLPRPSGARPPPARFLLSSLSSCAFCMAAASCDTLMRTVRSADPSNAHSTRSALKQHVARLERGRGHLERVRARRIRQHVRLSEGCPVRIAHFCAVGLRAGHQHRHGSGDVLLAAASTTKLSSCSSAASRSASCCCEAGWSGCCTLRIVAGGHARHDRDTQQQRARRQPERRLRGGEGRRALRSLPVAHEQPERHGAARRAHERERSREAQDQADDRQHKRQALARRYGGARPRRETRRCPLRTSRACTAPRLLCRRHPHRGPTSRIPPP